MSYLENLHTYISLFEESRFKWLIDDAFLDEGLFKDTSNSMQYLVNTNNSYTSIRIFPYN